jgi:soluble lytic murein transglycosylase-like protein
LTDYRTAAADVAQRYGIPPDIFARVIGAESGWNPTARSPAGAIGLGQLMPGTAKELGVDPSDPMQNLDGAARYLKEQYDRFGDWKLASAAYNAGPGAVEKYGGVPPFKETQDYVSKIYGDGNALGSYADKARDPTDMNALQALLQQQQQPQGFRLHGGIDPALFGLDPMTYRRV